MQAQNSMGRTKYNVCLTGVKKHTDPGADTETDNYTSAFNVKSKQGQREAHTQAKA